MFHSKLKKRVKNVENVVNDLAQHCGTWADFYDETDTEVGDGMRLGGREVKICDAVRAVVEHLGIDVGITATKKSPKKQQVKRSK